MMNRTRAAGALIAILSICGCATTNSQPATGSAKAPCAENTGSRLQAGNCSSIAHTGQ
jgi:hypothetical protein